MTTHVCYQCRNEGVERKFSTDEQLREHEDLRHQGKRASYEKVKPLPPEASPAEFERVHKEIDRACRTLEDQQEEIEARLEALELLLRQVRKLGHLDSQGRAKKVKGAPGKKSPAAPEKKTGSVTHAAKPKKLTGKAPTSPGKERPPHPPGKTIWDSKHQRWTATPPKPRSGSAAKKRSTTPIADAARKSAGVDDDEPAGPD